MRGFRDVLKGRGHPKTRVGSSNFNMQKLIFWEIEEGLNHVLPSLDLIMFVYHSAFDCTNLKVGEIPISNVSRASYFSHGANS